MFDLEKIRKDFPYISKKDSYIYFDNAATTQKPKCAIDSLYNFYLYEYATIHRAVYQSSLLATERYDQTRLRIKDFINAKSDKEIVFTKGTTDSINLVAGGIEDLFTQDDEILISITEHHSNLIPWQILAKKKNAILKFIPVNDKGEIDLIAFKKLLNKKTKLVALAHIANSTGCIHPIKEIIEEAHKFNSIVLIDGAQAMGHLKVDVQDLDCDFYAFSSHKMYGPNAVGILYGKTRLLKSLSPYQTGGDMVAKVSLYDATYSEPPLRFEAGTAAIAEVIAFKDVIDYLDNIGLDNIHKHEQKLLEHAQEKLLQINGLKIIGTSANKSAIISFVINKTHPLDIGTLLDLKKIAIRTGQHCSSTTMDRFNVHSTSRVSFGLYNTLDEVDYFVDSLKDILKKI